MFSSHLVMRRLETPLTVRLNTQPPHSSLSIPRLFIVCTWVSDFDFVCVVFWLQDTFFYSLVYDPQQKTLLADKGEIRVGNKYQAEITDLLNEGMSVFSAVLSNGCFFFSSFFPSPLLLQSLNNQMLETCTKKHIPLCCTPSILIHISSLAFSLSSLWRGDCSSLKRLWNYIS